MIVQLLGANGAGKSTIVTSLMSGQPRSPVHLWRRRVPDGYVLRKFAVVGHYEGSACGGGDTLPRDKVVETIGRLYWSGIPVLLEGPTGREPFLTGDDVRVVYLRRNIEQNLDDWLQRNKAKGLSSNRATMLRRVRAATTRCDRMVTKYLERGVNVTTTESREVARECIQNLIGRGR